MTDTSGKTPGVVSFAREGEGVFCDILIGDTAHQTFVPGETLSTIDDRWILHVPVDIRTLLGVSWSAAVEKLDPGCGLSGARVLRWFSIGVIY